MNQWNYKKGFTLLELLVVIAIIGILAAIILSYLGQSKNKGGEAGVKSNLTSARSQIALYYANNASSYAAVCLDSTVRRMVQRSMDASAKTPQVAAYANTDSGSWNTETCHSSATQYAIWVPLRDSTSVTSIGWCIDNTDGGSRRVQVAGSTGLAANALVCPP